MSVRAISLHSGIYQDQKKNMGGSSAKTPMFIIHFKQTSMNSSATKLRTWSQAKWVIVDHCSPLPIEQLRDISNSNWINISGWVGVSQNFVTDKDMGRFKILSKIIPWNVVLREYALFWVSLILAIWNILSLKKYHDNLPYIEYCIQWRSILVAKASCQL